MKISIEKLLLRTQVAPISELLESPPTAKTKPLSDRATLLP